MVNNRVKIAVGLLAVAGVGAYYVPRPRTAASAAGLPRETEAKQILNHTQRHREWVSLPVGSAGMRVFTVYPERSDNGPAILITSKHQSASAWMRATAVRLADEGYIAVVPDVLSGLAPNGGDEDSFATSEDIRAALAGMDSQELARRVESARQYAVHLPAADGHSVTLFVDGDRVYASLTGKDSQGFSLNNVGWAQTREFLTKGTGNHPIAGVNPNQPEDHSMHIGMAMAQTPPQQKGPPGPMGYPRGKLPELPAGVFTAHSAITNSKLRKEFVDIPMGTGKLHTWVEYPEGTGKAPIVIVMQHGPGMDDWQRALADQLAQQGFIAIAADLHSGLGPNGGAYDSFQATDEVMRATARLTPEDMQNRYKTALEWGKKLPRWNGKAASIGFCMGGGNSFRFAAEVPDLAAAVSFYGATPSEELQAKIKAPILAFYGEDDARVTAAAEPTKASMGKLGKTFEHYVYPHATHGFLEFQDLAGNPTATSDSWTKTIDFLRKQTR